MTLEQIIAAAKAAGMDEAGIAAIQALDTSAEVTRLTGELASEQGKNSGILADKKKFKDRAEKAEADLKKIETDKLPEDEKHAQQLKEMQDKLDQETATREKQEADFKLQQREATLSDLTGSVKWAEGTPQGTAKLIVKNALADVEDLSDEKKVSDILTGIKDSHKSFIAADAPGGTGNKQVGGDKGGGSDDEPASMQDIVDEAWADK